MVIEMVIEMVISMTDEFTYNDRCVNYNDR